METQRFIQFYATKERQYVNKLFSFRINEYQDCFRVMLTFYYAGNTFRSAYYKTIDNNLSQGSATYLRLYNHEEFFRSYDITHNPTLREAINDFLMMFM